MARAIPADDDLLYEVVSVDLKTGLYRRDGLPYRGKRLASRMAARMTKLGDTSKVLPWKPLDQRQDMNEAVA